MVGRVGVGERREQEPSMRKQLEAFHLSLPFLGEKTLAQISILSRLRTALYILPIVLVYRRLMIKLCHLK